MAFFELNIGRIVKFLSYTLESREFRQVSDSDQSPYILFNLSWFPIFYESLCRHIVCFRSFRVL